MWKFVFAGCCLLLYVGADPLPGRGALKGFCKINSHCSEDECCVSFEQRRGKRNAGNTLPSSLMKYVDGKCEKLGTSGSGCYVKYFTSTPDIYSDSCPCNAGFTCDGTREFEVPQGEIECYARGFKSPPDIYLDSCPCRVGFTCVGTGQIVVQQGELGTCIMFSKDE